MPNFEVIEIIGQVIDFQILQVVRKGNSNPFYGR